MRDKKVSLPRINTLHPLIRGEVKLIIEKIELGFPPTVAVRVVQAYRSINEQNALYAQGRTIPGPNVRPDHPLGDTVTSAHGGSSNHNYGLAFDFALLYDKDGNGSYEVLSWDTVKDLDRDGQADWMEVVKEFESAKYDWGGRWKSRKDNPHIEKTFGFTIGQLLDKTIRGRVDEQGYVLI